jgi:hypothetical protein
MNRWTSRTVHRGTQGEPSSTAVPPFGSDQTERDGECHGGMWPRPRPGIYRKNAVNLALPWARESGLSHAEATAPRVGLQADWCQLYGWCKPLTGRRSESSEWRAYFGHVQVSELERESEHISFELAYRAGTRAVLPRGLGLPDTKKAAQYFGCAVLGFESTVRATSRMASLRPIPLASRL